MTGSLLRVALVISICLQLILWSHSRQAQVDVSIPNHSLQRRSHDWTRLTSKNDSISSLSNSCAPRSEPIEYQCQHVQEHCKHSKTLLRISYVSKYFCAPARLRPGFFMGLVVWLIFLFSTLGIGASDFFCPNLATISAILGLDENVAGVTFLALGNGSPDVFSTFSAMKANSGSLAIGELLGAASFIVSVVVGSMAIIKPFRVNKGPFLRDVGFFTIAIAVLLAILIDGVIKAWEAGLLVALYTLYVGVVVIGSWYERRQENFRAKDQLVRAEYGPEDPDVVAAAMAPYRDEPVEPYRDDDTETLAVPSASSPRTRAHSSPDFPSSERPEDRRLSLHIPPHRPRARSNSQASIHTPQNLPSFSLLGALEFRTAVNMLRQQSNAANLNIFEQSPLTPFAGGHYHHPITGTSRRSTIHSEEETGSFPWEASSGVPLDERHNEELGHGGLRPWAAGGVNASVPSISIQTEDGEMITSPMASEFPSPVQKPLRSKRQRLKDTLSLTGRILFPTFEHFTEKSGLGMVAALFAAPAVLALTLTLPVVLTPREDLEVLEKQENGTGPSMGQLIEFEEDGVERALVAEAESEVDEEMRDMEFNKWLMAVQCILGPLFCLSVLFGTSLNFSYYFALTAAAGAVVAVLVAVFADRGNDPAARVVRCSMGFFVAIIWIMAIADEVVQVLQTFGLIFGLSDAIIGLTIFAVGNSLADFVANITVAAFAPIMGFSACFGGPMLNILLGVGLSGTYVIRQTGQDYRLHFSTTLLVSSIGLLCLLLATVIFVPWNGFMLSRAWGIFLISCYVVVMVVNIVVELKQDSAL